MVVYPPCPCGDRVQRPAERLASAFCGWWEGGMPSGGRRRTYVYVDGFNLFYGALKGTPHKWLDLPALCRRLFPNYDVRKIKYFTARVKATPIDPDISNRQDAYIRALRTFPDIQIIEGSFLKKKERHLLEKGRGYVQLKRFEEKGSDVNLGAHLVHDAHKPAFDAAILISNDSDLLEPVRIVRQELGLHVGVALPLSRPDRKPSHMLTASGVASALWHLRQATPFRKSQLPDPIVDARGKKIHKPEDW